MTNEVLLGDDCPFVAIAVASFDIVSGIRVIHRWLFSQNPLKTRLEDVFKVTLSNVHRQNERCFLETALSSVEIPQFDWYLINSVFFINQKKIRNAYYSLSIITKTSKIKNNPYFYHLLNTNSRILSDLLRQVILSSQPYTTLTSAITTIASNFEQIVKCEIKFIPKCNFSDADSSFLSLLLMSHLQTQMTTVIEIGQSQQSEAQNISAFLSHFLLPSQLEMSSLEVHQRPILGLFLQIVSRQKTSRKELMIQFNRPVTWVRLSDHTIEQTEVDSSSVADIPDLSNKYIFNLYMEQIQANYRGSAASILQRYRTEQVKTPSPWSCVTVQYIAQSPEATQDAVSRIQLNEIVRTAVTYVALVSEKEKQNGVFVLPNNQRDAVMRALRIVEMEDLKMVRSIAQFFNSKIPAKYGSKPQRIAKI